MAPPVNGICELTLESADPEALARFYEDVLGLERMSVEENGRPRDRIWLACGEQTRLGLWKPGEKEFGDQGGRHVHFAFSVSPGTLDALRERLREGGLECEGPVEHEGGDRSLYLRDPAGNVVEAWDFFDGDANDVSDLAED